jgi:hypothetical protein
MAAGTLVLSRIVNKIKKFSAGGVSSFVLAKHGSGAAADRTICEDFGHAGTMFVIKSGDAKPGKVSSKPMALKGVYAKKLERGQKLYQPIRSTYVEVMLGFYKNF